MDFQSDRTLRLTQGNVDVDMLPTEARMAEVREGVFVGNKAAAEEKRGFALLACNGQLPEWWNDHALRSAPAVALGFDDLEVNHSPAKMNMLRLSAGFIRTVRNEEMPVLIYCCHGSSRSVVTAAYHLVRSERLSPAQALEEVMAHVSWAAPSLGMIELLVRASEPQAAP